MVDDKEQNKRVVRRCSQHEMSKEETLLILEAFLMRSLSSNDASPLRYFYEQQHDKELANLSPRNLDKPHMSSSVPASYVKSASITNQKSERTNERLSANGKILPQKTVEKPSKKPFVKRQTAIRPRSYSEAVKGGAGGAGQQTISDSKRSQSLDSKLPNKVNTEPSNNSQPSKKSLSAVSSFLYQIRKGMKFRKSGLKEKNQKKISGKNRSTEVTHNTDGGGKVSKYLMKMFTNDFCL